MLRTCTTLDNLRSELLRQHDQQISRSGLYLRLIPRLGNSKEGRRHVQTGNLCFIQICLRKEALIINVYIVKRIL